MKATEDCTMNYKRERSSIQLHLQISQGLVFSDRFRETNNGISSERVLKHQKRYFVSAETNIPFLTIPEVPKRWGAPSRGGGGS
jgi:hypothetical protein